MNTLQKLKKTRNIEDFAKVLNTRTHYLKFILSRYYRGLETHPLYHGFTIPKKSGGLRLIKAPVPPLKKLQKRLSDVLYACLAEIDSQRDAQPVSFAFHKKLQIADNAHNHRAKRYVLNLDLQDFFPSFTYARIKGFFIKSRDFQLDATVAGLLARLACDESGLPQGAPSSPIISELMGRILDIRLLRLARKYSIRYSRYADDITFSTYKEHFPADLAYLDPDAENPTEWVLGETLKETISRAGFSINHKKTRMQQCHARQMVNGLIVNKKVNIKEEYYKNTRAMCHKLFATGSFHINGDKGTLNELAGRLGYIYTIKKFSLPAPFKSHPTPAIFSLYRQFLFYKTFLAATKPILVTENKEHHFYIKETINHIEASHSFFIEKNNHELKIRFFRYTTLFKELFKQKPSYNYLKSILVDYKRFTGHSKSSTNIVHKPCTHPVIIVINNNDSLKKIAPLIEKLFTKKISTRSSSPFYHLSNNLYLVKMPEKHPITRNPETCFEDFIPSTWHTKTKSHYDKENIDIYYRKNTPPKKEFQKTPSQINLSFLEGLLLRIKKVIDHHHNELS